MPAIWNINNSYNVNNNSNKKVASKLTFDVGEKFSGKIMKTGDGNEVSIKLTDGWEFSAELDGDLDSLEKGFHKFEVEGFKDGKLKLKLINKDGIAEKPSKGELNNILSKEGLSKKDIPLLEAMLKYDIPLSKENIKFVKGLIKFNEKIQSNPKEIEAFISKYLESKGIDGTSIKGQAITQKLEQFFNVFKNLSKEEVLLFLENNIEFTKENIESYNKLFKENGKVLDIVDEIKNRIEGKEPIDISGKKQNITSEITSGNRFVIDENKGFKDIDNNTEILKENSNLDLKKNNIEEKSIQNTKTINDNVKIDSNKLENVNNKLENVSNKLENANNKLENANNKLENANNKLENANNKLLTGAYEKNDIMQNKVSVLAVLKSLMGEGENSLNVELKELINARRGEFTTKEFDKSYNIINKMDNESFISMVKDAIGQFDNKSINVFNDYVSERINEVKSSIGEVPFNKVELENVLSNIIGKDIVLTEEEFSKIKDIINLKTTVEHKNDTKTNEVKELLDDKSLSLESKSDKGIVNSKVDNTDVLKDLIKDKIPSQEIVKSIISAKGEEGKEIIKSILESIKNEALPEKILDQIKNNISDIKLFNKISQEYYYLDVPVTIKEQEYPCKLILKDNRKGGKKIDSTNVKMVVTVKTGNLGTVDGYIKVLENKIDIDLKCEKSFVKILDFGKERLVSNIKSLGFNISVNVSKKEDEVSLTNCREFFNENNMANIDIKV